MRSIRPTVIHRRTSLCSSRIKTDLRHAVGLDRNGAFLVVALICLVLSTALVGSVLSMAQRQQRQMLHYQRQLQAEWLAESGLERAAFRLRTDSLYPGEVWSISSAELGGGEPGSVSIQVQPVPDQANGRLVHVEATYPAGSLPQHIRRTKQSIVILSQEL